MKKIYGYFVFGGAVVLLALALVPLLSAEEPPAMTVAQARAALKEAHEAWMAGNSDRAIELGECILKAYPNGFRATWPENLRELAGKGDLEAIRQAYERGEVLDTGVGAILALAYWYGKHDAAKAAGAAEIALQEVPDSQRMPVILQRARAALAAQGQNPGPPVVLVNRRYVRSVPPQDSQAPPAKLLVRVNQVAVASGLTTTFDARTNTVTLSSPAHTCRLVLEQKEAVVDGQTVALEVAPTRVEGEIVVPLAILESYFGAKVQWDAQTRIALVAVPRPPAQAG